MNTNLVSAPASAPSPFAEVAVSLKLQGYGAIERRNRSETEVLTYRDARDFVEAIRRDQPRRIFERLDAKGSSAELSFLNRQGQLHTITIAEAKSAGATDYGLIKEASKAESVSNIKGHLVASEINGSVYCIYSGYETPDARKQAGGPKAVLSDWIASVWSANPALARIEYLAHPQGLMLNAIVRGQQHIANAGSEKLGEILRNIPYASAEQVTLKDAKAWLLEVISK